MNIIRLFSFLTVFGLLFFSTAVYGKEDKTEADVEVDEEPISRLDETLGRESDVNDEKDDNDPNRIPSSPDFRTMHVFIQPPQATELVAGKLTRLLVGTHNNGTQNFIVESIEGSLRYPQDYTYYIQNFTALRSEKVVEPGLESTFEYLFMPSETFNGRSMGLVVLINYRNNEGKHFQNVIFNQTINLTDADEGFDGETFFLYIFLGALIILVAFFAYQYLLSHRLKGMSTKSSSRTLGNQQTKGNYDPEWIPKHHLIQNRSPKKIPRQRKTGKNLNETNSTGAASSENDE